MTDWSLLLTSIVTGLCVGGLVSCAQAAVEAGVSLTRKRK
jgi:hypothetical protein